MQPNNLISYKANKSLLKICIALCLSTLSLKAQDSNTTVAHGEVTKTMGDVILFALPIATVGTSFIIGDEKGVWQFTKGFLLTQAVTYGLKLGVNKPRPDMSNNNSFPSGHTSTVFHSAGYIHRRYGFKYSIPAYILAGFTAASRIDANKHDILDLLAGATIGLGSNLLFTTEYQQEHMELTFSSNELGSMLGFSYKF